MTCTKVFGPVTGQPAETIIETEDKRFVTDNQIAQWTSATGEKAAYMSLVFQRAIVTPATPTGGSFSYPIPDGGLWTDNPLPGSSPLYITTRFFTSDGEPPQASVWSPPRIFVVNGEQGPGGPTGNAGPAGGNGLNGAAGVDGDNGISIVWLPNSITHPIGAVNGNAYYNSGDGKSYIFQDDTWYQMSVDGINGTSAQHRAVISLYQKSTDGIVAPDDPTGTFEYVYGTGILTEAVNAVSIEIINGLSVETPLPDGDFNGWETTLPSIVSGEFIWVIQALAVSIEDSDYIPASEFSGGVVLSAAGLNGLKTAGIYLYNKATSNTISPAIPVGSFIYTFDTYGLAPVNGSTTINGWTKNAPNINAGEFLWFIQGVASSITNTDQVEATEFSDPVVISATGNNGLDIVWKGALASPPANPQENWVYRDTDNNIIYIYNGVAWELMVLDGADGPTGATGANGLSVYITYHDADPDASAPILPTDIAGTNNNWHTNPTEAAGWMSQKIDTTPATSAGWGAAIRIKGIDGIVGVEGQRGSSVFTFDEADVGTTYTDATDAAAWAGTLTSTAAQQIARDIIEYFSVDGYIRPNDKITVTDRSASKAGTRIYLGAATNNSFAVGLNFSSLVVETVDGSLLVNGTVSANSIATDAVTAIKILGNSITADKYNELRNSIVFNGGESLDASYPFIVPFQILSEMTVIQAIKLSLRILPYRAYSTAASSGGSTNQTDTTTQVDIATHAHDVYVSDGNYTQSANIYYYPADNKLYHQVVTTSNYNIPMRTADDHTHNLILYSANAAGLNVGTMNAIAADIYSGNMMCAGGGTVTTSESSGHVHTFTLGVSTGNYAYLGYSPVGSSGYVGTTSMIGGDYSQLSGASPSKHNHSVTVAVPSHIHGITYGIHEEVTSPTIYVDTNNTIDLTSFTQRASYTGDQIDVNLTSYFSGTGWRSLRFRSSLRCRIFYTLILKLDLTA